MKIGIDIDNTITHTTEIILHYAGIFGNERKLNTIPDTNYYYLEDVLGWDEYSSDLFLNTYLGTIYREMKPKEKAVAAIKQLKQKHELILITSRNQNFHEVEKVTRDWLQHYEIPYDDLILNTTSNMHHFSKLEACMQNGVGLMIEDHHELAWEISQEMPVLLFDYPYNRHLSSENIIRVKHWNEVLTWVEQLPARGRRV